jgi:hypothetical protein
VEQDGPACVTPFAFPPEHPQASAATSTAARATERGALRGSAEEKPALCLMKPSNDPADLLRDEAELVGMRVFSREDGHDLPQATGKRFGIGRGGVQRDRRGDQIVRQGGRCGKSERQRGASWSAGGDPRVAPGAPRSWLRTLRKGIQRLSDLALTQATQPGIRRFAANPGRWFGLMEPRPRADHRAMDVQGAAALARRIAEQANWRLAAAVLDGRQPAVDPDRELLESFEDAERTYSDGSQKLLLDGWWQKQSR